MAEFEASSDGDAVTSPSDLLPPSGSQVELDDVTARRRVGSSPTQHLMQRGEEEEDGHSASVRSSRSRSGAVSGPPPDSFTTSAAAALSLANTNFEPDSHSAQSPPGSTSSSSSSVTAGGRKRAERGGGRGGATSSPQLQSRAPETLLTPEQDEDSQLELNPDENKLLSTATPEHRTMTTQNTLTTQRASSTNTAIQIKDDSTPTFTCADTHTAISTTTVTAIPPQTTIQALRETEIPSRTEISAQLVDAEVSSTQETIHRTESEGSGGFAISAPIATPNSGTSERRESQVSNEGLSYVGGELGVSPYVVVKGGLADVSKFESPGLLYARSTQEKHNLDILRPADEVAEDVLDGWQPQERLNFEPHGEGRREEEIRRGGRGGRGGGRVMVMNVSGVHSQGELTGSDRDGINHIDSSEDTSLLGSATMLMDSDQSMVPIDPHILLNLEQQAQKVAGSLTYIMDNLRNSLYAMTVCAKESVCLHREAVDNVHTLVDSNIKASYAFLAKFEELQRHTLPLTELAQQIKEINETLKILERTFKTP